MASRLGPKEVKRQMDAAKRRTKAVDLVIQGWSFRAIAKELGYAGPSGVKKAVDTAIADVPSRSVEFLRTEVEERSRIMLEQLMPLVVNTRASREDRLDAMDRVIKIDKELRSLHGLDAPTKVTFDVSKMSDEQLREIVAGAGGEPASSGASGALPPSGQGDEAPPEAGTGEGEGAGARSPE